jgi:Histidine kinase-, DNA gyrase B-, and HSP90-like ATPase
MRRVTIAAALITAGLMAAACGTARAHGPGASPRAIERSIPGTGLGLAIVRTIVDNHGGTLTVASREGHGTTVCARLPLLSPASPPAGHQAAGHDGSPAPASSGPETAPVSGG